MDAVWHCCSPEYFIEHFCLLLVEAQSMLLLKWTVDMYSAVQKFKALNIMKIIFKNCVDEQ